MSIWEYLVLMQRELPLLSYRYILYTNITIDGSIFLENLLGKGKSDFLKNGKKSPKPSIFDRSLQIKRCFIQKNVRINPGEKTYQKVRVSIAKLS